MPSQVKEKFVQELTEEFKSSSHLIVTDYQGLTSEEFGELRSKLDGLGAKFKVVKNRLAKIAVKNVGWEGLEDSLKGPTAVAFKGEDVASITKVLNEISKKNTSFKLKAGHLFGKPASKDEIKAIASLPSREVLLATLLSRLNGPLTTFVATLNEPIRSLHAALSSLAKKKESAPAA